MSDIRYNQWLHNSGTGGVSQDAGGNIGIGTTAPLIPVGAGNTTILNVGVVTANYIYGTVQGAIEGTLDDWIVHAGDTNTKFGFPGTDQFSVYTAGDERLRIKSNGFVGIGTDNPTRVVHVQDDSNTLLSLDSTDSNADLVQSDTSGSTRIRSASGALEFFLGGDASSTNATGSGKKLTISSAGKLGIGEDNPSYHTEIKMSSTDAYSTSTLNSGQHQLRVNNAGAEGVAGILLTAEPSSGSAGHAGIRVIAPANGSADMTFSTRNASTYGERLRIASNGQVCIGEGFKSSGGGQLTIRGLGVNAYAVQDYQYIGTPSGANTTLSQIRFTANTSGNSVIQGARIQARSDAAWSATGDAPTRLEFWTTPDGSVTTAERLRITSSGQFHMGGGNSWTYASQKFIVVEPNNALGMLLQGNNANEGVNLTLQNIVNANNAYSSLSFADDGGQIFGLVRGKVIDKNANTGDLQFHTHNGTSLAERIVLKSDGKVGMQIADPKSNLHVYGPGEIRLGTANGGHASIMEQVEYSSGYTGVHWMFETNQQISWSFDGVMIVHGSGGSSYGTEVTHIKIVYSRESGALNSGDTWRNGSSDYNIETLGHAQVGLNPSAGSFSYSEQTNPDGAGSTRSLLKLSWSASGQSVGVWSKLIGNFYWGTGTSGNVEIQDKDGNIKFNSNP